MDKNRLSLHKQAVGYLESQRGRWRTIANDTGLGYDWLKKLGNDDWDDPGVNKIERLLSYAGLMK